VNLDELRPILAAYRRSVEQAWSPATAHEGYDGKAGDPAGQCGVTSAWLQRRLLEDHGIGTTFWLGQLYAASDEKAVRHCWLELDPEFDVVIDLTADQMPSLKGRPVICEVYGDLLRDGVDYYAYHSLRTPELLGELHARLATLTSAVGS
jgi:hypothetical protein